jgi:hypothetical protein
MILLDSKGGATSAPQSATPQHAAKSHQQPAHTEEEVPHEVAGKEDEVLPEDIPF